MLDYINKIVSNYDIRMVTEIGSQMWGMDHVDSDHDIIVIYSVPTKTILRGDKYKSNLPSKHHIEIECSLYDFQFIEIGHFVNLLKKGNINAVFAILSPLSVVMQDEIKELRKVISSIEFTTAMIPSTIGWAKSQLADMEKRKDTRDPTKSLRCAYRTTKWMSDFLQLYVIPEDACLPPIKLGDVKFEPVKSDICVEEVECIIWNLETFKHQYEDQTPEDCFPIKRSQKQHP